MFTMCEQMSGNNGFANQVLACKLACGCRGLGQAICTGPISIFLGLNHYTGVADLEYFPH